ncbi:MAG: protein kinase [Bacteroidota bacterium]
MSDPSPERWAAIRALFDAVAELPVDEQDAALDAAWRQLAGADRQLDAALRSEVRALLDADAAASGLDHSAPERAAELVIDADDMADASDTVSGAAFGPWQVEREIGRGGMGAVYRVARADGAYTQHAALKRLTHAGPGRAERFRQERQILARLDHPGIARLLDGGVTPPAPGHPDGTPYLVMEHVAGEPITRYADRRQLDVAARVRLFVQVCDALAYAHRHLVVHRDVKPSNVFVTEEEDTPHVKLLDFGVAKLLADDPDAGLTQTGLAHLTPEYAAPEQVEGGAITAATDVYALGVLLYELLAGQRPYEIPRPTLSSIVEVVCHTRPVAPSAVATGDRPRALRGDLDTIVMKALAKEPERRYRSALELGADLTRYLDGHPVEARSPTVGYRARRFVGRHRTLIGVALLALGIALSAVVVSARRVVAERDVARRAAADAAAVAEVQGEILEVLDPAFRAELDTSSQNARAPSITDVVDRALDKVERAYEENPAVLARSLATLGTTLFHRGEQIRADSLFARALELRRPLAQARDPVIWEALIGRGLVARRQGDYAAARAFFQEALEIEQAHPDVLENREKGTTELYLAGVLEDPSERERELLRTLTERKISLPAGDIGIAQAHNDLATYYFRNGDSQLAYAEFATAERIARGTFGDLHPAMSVIRTNMVFTLGRLARYVEAERLARMALDAAERGELGPARMGAMHHALSHPLLAQNRTEEAEREVRTALGFLNEAHGVDSPPTRAATKDHIILLMELGRVNEALETASHWEAVQRREEGRASAMPRITVAACLFANGQRAEAMERLEGVLREMEEGDMAPESRVDILHTAGDMLRASGEADRAEPMLREALDRSRSTLADTAWRVQRIRLSLGLALADLGRVEDARPHLDAIRGRFGHVGYPVPVEDPEAAMARIVGT